MSRARPSTSNRDGKTYVVRVEPWDRGYEIHVEGVGVTQAEHIDEVHMMAMDYIQCLLDVDQSDIELVFPYWLEG